MAVLDNPNRQARVSTLQADCISFFDSQKDASTDIAASFSKLMALYGSANVSFETLFENMSYEHMVFEGGQHFDDYNALLSILKSGARAASGVSEVICGLSATVSVGASAAGYLILRNAAINSLIRDIGMGFLPRTVRWLPQFGNTGRLISTEMRAIAETVPYVRTLRSVGRISGRVFIWATPFFLAFEIGAYQLEKDQLQDAIKQLVPERVKYYYGWKVLDELKSEVGAALKAANALKEVDALTDTTAKRLFDGVLQKVNKASGDVKSNVLKHLKSRDEQSNQYTSDDPTVTDLSFIDQEIPHLKKLTIKHGWLVDSIACDSTDADMSITYGGSGGQNTDVITFDHDEYIKDVNWQRGRYNGKSVVVGLKITTSKGRTYGPFGSKVGELGTGSPLTFTTPKDFRVVRLVDFDAKLTQSGEKPVWDMPEFIANLKMEVRRAP